MKKYLVCGIIRYNANGRAKVVPSMIIHKVEAPSLALASHEFHQEFNILNPVLAVVDVTHLTQGMLLDLQRSLEYAYGNTTYKHGK